jgi:hypothetical protein
MNSKLSEVLKVTQYDFDPDGTSAVDVAWVDMRDYDRIMFLFFRTVGTSDVTVKVLGNSASNGSGTDVEIVALTNAAFGDPDAVGDYVFVEVSQDDLIAASATDGACRYVSLNLAFGTGTDEAVVTYIRGGAKHPQSGLTANAVA